MVSFKGRHFNKEMILQSVRWYLAYSLSCRDIEEMMQERGFDTDHSTLNRWVVDYIHRARESLSLKEETSREPLANGRDLY